MTDEHPARAMSTRSMDAVKRKAKDEWVALFADDGFVQDPVGVSPLDEAGEGHHGHAGIAAFWDATIATLDDVGFEIHDSFAAGDECANVATIVAYLPGGMVMRTEGVFVYRLDPDGRLHSLRAFWEWDRAMATIGPRD
ncbi:MAG: nuclear transport factor 2 family protein [Actinomycetota bacterium]|nr:nuclear transport factor 2 family protein [Actinomycetota bacterium]